MNALREPGITRWTYGLKGSLPRPIPTDVALIGVCRTATKGRVQ
jgi:hypothetical protein